MKIMKMTIFYLVIITGLMVAIGCNTAASGTLEKHGNDTATYHIKHVLCRLDSARQDILYFNSLCQTHLKDTNPPISAYTIRAIDLLGALGLPATLGDSARYKHIRMYIGYRQNSGFKLYLVPVDSASLAGTDPSQWRGGYDVLLDSVGKGIPRHKMNLRNDTETGYVLDLNAPCPNTCAENALLEQ
jgi:hypothetical protein